MQMPVRLILAVATLAASPFALASSADHQSQRQQLEARLPELLSASGTPSAAIALIADGRLRWTLVAGEQGAGIPATESTLYNVASLTKPISAEVVLRQLAASDGSVDDALSTHWIDRDIADDPRHAELTPR